MSFFHASQRDALNQSLAEVQGQINVSFEFFPPRTSEMEQTLWNSIRCKRHRRRRYSHCGRLCTGVQD